MCPADRKRYLRLKLLEGPTMSQVLGTTRLASWLSRQGISADASMATRASSSAPRPSKVSRGKTRVLVATDVAARAPISTTGPTSPKTTERQRSAVRRIAAREREEAAKLKALREAEHVGITDMEAGRFFTFDTDEALDSQLATVADEAIGAA